MFLQIDEGTTGLSIEYYKGIKHTTHTGRIDLIVTKSASRFARNSIASMTAKRELKEVEVENLA